ncbi:hypothetical protein [Chitinophaga sp. sic0106]|uniref:hypothetical protein n=1 Tax=Chitinophaga sp. sic0106 TaxID=2854785 RepID=UPI001C4551C5|nr:hypothetical protein [Chitinophaga sp. sic0106]MBV7532184.1 hypothetical protein [Chitinophaga sp. sic0106]
MEQQFEPGKEINLEEARRIMEARKSYYRKMELGLRIATGILHDEAVTNYFLSSQNSFKFTREELQQLLNSGADYFSVVQGAHPEASPNFKIGEPTVMIIPCLDPVTKDMNAVQEGGIILEATGMKDGAIHAKAIVAAGDPPYVGLEHPPATNVTQINNV